MFGYFFKPKMIPSAREAALMSSLKLNELDLADSHKAERQLYALRKDARLAIGKMIKKGETWTKLYPYRGSTLMLLRVIKAVSDELRALGYEIVAGHYGYGGLSFIKITIPKDTSHESQR